MINFDFKILEFTEYFVMSFGILDGILNSFNRGI